MNRIREQIELYATEMNEDILLADGFDDALIGLVERAGEPTTALYDLDKCIQILIDRDGMTEDEADEYFTFNVIGAYMGEYTPHFATLLKEGVDK